MLTSCQQGIHMHAHCKYNVNGVQDHALRSVIEVMNTDEKHMDLN